MSKDKQHKANSGKKDKVTDPSSKRLFSWLVSGWILVGFSFGVLTSAAGVIYAFRTSYAKFSLPETGSNENMLADEDSCRKEGGRFDKKTGECNLKTVDYKTKCTKNDDCQGLCMAEEDSLLGNKESGYCSIEFNMSGCFKFIDEGMVNSICLD